MNTLKKMISLGTAALLSLSAVTVASAADDKPTFKKTDKPTAVVSRAQGGLNRLLKKSPIPSQSIAPRAVLPESYSSLEQGFVTSVKNQNPHNTCWTFAAMSTLESLLLKKGFGEYDFSEEHLDVWSTPRADGTGWQRKLNDGGYPMTTMGYLASWKGARLESDIPFDYATGKTFEEVDALGKTEYGVTSIVKLPNDHNVIKTAIVDYGAVTASFAANKEFMDNKYRSAYGYKMLDSAEIEGHAISIVGWNDNYSRTDLTTSDNHTPSKNGAWLCKNSWGTWAGFDGYFWISYEDMYLFSDIMGDPYAIRDAVKITDNTKLYQAEEYGATYELALYSSSGYVTDMTYINKYDFTDKYGNLESVTFDTTSVGADYTVYLIPLDNSGAPIDNESQWTELAGGTVDYSGYINVPINSELPYDECAIGITIDGTSANVQSSFGCDEWIEDGAGNIQFMPTVKDNVSYVKFGSDIYELTDFYSDFLGDDIGSNFVIKAITTAEDNTAKCDVNQDGKVSLADTVLTLRSNLGTVQLSHSGMYGADANSDGSVTAADAVIIQQKILGIA